MTPEERAEKIARKVCCDECFAVEDFPIIAAEIADACRLAVEEEQQLRADWNYRIECLERQLADAYEDAAKIVRNARVVYTDTAKDVFDYAAELIRARAADHKNCVKLNFIGKLDPLPFQWDDDEEVGK